MSLLSRAQVKRVFGVIALCATGVVGCTQLDTWQRQEIFAPNPEPQSWWSDPPAGTEIFNIALTPHEHVNAWYWQSPKKGAPTVLYLHGARWNLRGSEFRMEAWIDMGYSVLAIDYRGFGASSPRLPSEKSAGEDAEAALKELARRQPDPAKRFVYGHSLGGAVAIDLASRPSLPSFAGLIVESSFTSISAMFATLRWGRLPGASLLVTQPFDSIDKIANLRIPVLFVHGTADQIVPDRMSDQLYAAAIHVPPALRRLVKIDGASHSGAVRSGSEYTSPIEAFIHDAQRAYAAGNKQQATPTEKVGAIDAPAVHSTLAQTHNTQLPAL
jgi:alpha-beta hydrolase superfamily lysophospholipase